MPDVKHRTSTCSRTISRPLDQDADGGTTGRARYHCLRAALVDLATSGQTAAYSTVGAGIGLDMQRRGDRTIIGRLLDEIDLAENAAGRPQLSAVVVLKQANYPSRGFFAIAHRLGRIGTSPDLAYWQDELQRVCAHWANG